MKGLKAPDWTREELILALDLYFTLDIAWLRKLTGNSPEMIELSQMLKKLTIHAPKYRQLDSFRSPSSVHMKLMNFLRCDSRYGKAGLPNGSKLEQVIWDEFKESKEKLKSEAKEIINKYLPLNGDKEYGQSGSMKIINRTGEDVLLRNLLNNIKQAFNEADMLSRHYNECRINAAFIESIDESQKIINEMYQKILNVNRWKSKLLELETSIKYTEYSDYKDDGVKENTQPVKSDVKFGKLVKSILSSMFLNKKLSEEDISNMLDEKWTRKTFRIRFPILKSIDQTLLVAEQQKVNEYQHYWNEPITYNGKQYLVCKEWFESNKKYFMEWIFKSDFDYQELSNEDFNIEKNKIVEMVKFPNRYKGLTISKDLLLFILQTIIEIDTEEIYIETSNILKKTSDRIQKESCYKSSQHCLNNIIKFLIEVGILVSYQDAKKGKYVIEDYELMKKLMDNPEIVMQYSV